jgi:hypothetical protein
MTAEEVYTLSASVGLRVNGANLPARKIPSPRAKPMHDGIYEAYISAKIVRLSVKMI